MGSEIHRNTYGTGYFRFGSSVDVALLYNPPQKVCDLGPNVAHVYRKDNRCPLHALDLSGQLHA